MAYSVTPAQLGLSFKEIYLSSALFFVVFSMEGPGILPYLEKVPLIQRSRLTGVNCSILNRWWNYKYGVFE